MAPAYRERLRIEGVTLAASGVVASAALVAFVPESRRWPLSTVAQLGATAALLELVGTRYVRRWLDRAEEVEPGQEGSGEPTPLWQLPLIMGGLAGVFVVLPETGLPASHTAGWDAALRVTGGCALVGLMQAVRWERIAAADESARGRRYVRGPGSHLVGGTKLAFTKRR
jgi:hypothetical protein